MLLLICMYAVQTTGEGEGEDSEQRGMYDKQENNAAAIEAEVSEAARVAAAASHGLKQTERIAAIEQAKRETRVKATIALANRQKVAVQAERDTNRAEYETQNRARAKAQAEAKLQVHAAQAKAHAQAQAQAQAHAKLQAKAKAPPPPPAQPATEKDPYVVLGVSKDISQGDLRKVYRILVKRWHPDLHPEKKEEAATKFTAINEVENILVDTLYPR